MNFLELPIVSATTISDTTTGEPFTTNARNLAYWGEFNLFIGTDAGTVYAARVQNDLYFVCISSGYYGYTWLSNSAATGKYELTSTSYSTIYDCKGLTLPSIYTWNIELTSFTDESAMLEMFYSTYVSTDPDVGDAIVVRVTAVPNDSQDEGGTSEEGGGDGTFDDTTDPVPAPVIPTISASNSGLITLFRPSLSQVQALGSYLWTNITDFIENLQKMFSNPMDYFIAFHIMPAVPEVLALRTIKLGLWETSIQMPPVKNQFYEFDCGTVTVSPYWNSALDYSPYTKIQLFLPFIGSVSLNTDEVMGNIVGITYRMDLLSGQCVALITINGDTYYQFTGECSVAIPLTGSDWSRVYTAAIGAITGVVAGFSGAASIANRAYPRENPALRTALTTSHIVSSVDNVAGNIMGAKPAISHSGNISGSAGFLGIRTPYMIIEYPNQSLPENYKHYVGYPSNIYSSLSDVTGYTECEQVIVKGISATEQEIAEITEALKAGVYL